MIFYVEWQKKEWPTRLTQKIKRNIAKKYKVELKKEKRKDFIDRIYTIARTNKRLGICKKYTKVTILLLSFLSDY